MPNGTNLKNAEFAGALRMDALVLGIFFVQTAIALVALSSKPQPEPQPAGTLQIAESVPVPDPVLPELTPEPVVPTPAPRVPARGPEPVPAGQLIPSGSSFVTLFGNGHNDTLWHVATHSNRDHPFFGNDWSADSADFSSEGLSLDVRKSGDRWESGEVKTKTLYGFGRYEVVMKPARASGLVSAFFTYTGPYFGDPHDEIDIEFVGKNMRKVEFNYFKDGRTLNHHVHDLPFDASEDFHLYAFEWYPDRIRWFVDNELVYETPEGDTNIPRTPASIYMNMWTGTLKGLKSWHGQPEFGEGITSEYACVSFTAPGEGSRRCSDLFDPPSLTEGQYVGLATVPSSLRR